MSDTETVKIAHPFRRWATNRLAQPGFIGGRVPQAWAEILKRDPWMKDVVMVCELVFGGVMGSRVIRVATEPVLTVDRDGVTYGAHAGLVEEPEIVSEYTLASPQSSARALQFSLPGEMVMADKLINSGSILSGVAEVYLVPRERFRGDTFAHEERWVLIRGDLIAPRFGDPGESVDFEVVDPKETITNLLPPWVITPERIGNVHETGIGQRYPLLSNGFTGYQVPRVTSVLTGINDFVIAYGHDSGWQVSNVWVNGVGKASGDATYGWTTLDSSDSRGDKFTILRFTNVATVWEDSDAVNVSLTRSDDLDLSILEILRTTMESYSPFGEPGTNRLLYAIAESRMEVGIGVKVLVNAAGGSDGATPIGWAEDGVCSQFPMLSMLWANGALGPIVTDRRAAPLASWTVGAGVCLDRATSYEETPKNDLLNEFVLRYNYDSLLKVYRSVVVRDYSNSAICQLSEDLADRRTDAVRDAPYIAEDGMALYVMDWLVEHLALPSYVAEFRVRPDCFIRYSPGDNVLLTDPDLEGWVDVPATIQRIRYRRGNAYVTLRCWRSYMNDFVGGSLSA